MSYFNHLVPSLPTHPRRRPGLCWVPLVASITLAACGGASGSAGVAGNTGPSGANGASGAAGATGLAGSTAGVTVLNASVTPSNDSNVVAVSVLSDTPASNAPVQAGVAANGAIASAAVSNAGPLSPVTSPIYANAQTLAGTALSIPAPGGLPVSSAGGVVSRLDSATTPVSPLANVAVDNTQVLGTAGQTAVINAGVASNGQLVSALVTTPAGTANPVSALDASAAGAGLQGSLGGVTSTLTSAAGGLPGGLSAPLTGSVVKN